ncbi:hypothetical protein ACOKS3_21895 [Pseudomonas sp. HS6-2]
MRHCVTTRVGMVPAQLRHYPDAGDIYAIRPELGGIARYAFKE